MSIHGEISRESETQVADYLDTLGISWNYQYPVFVYDDQERPRVWTPDFYLPKLGLFIEVCGSENFKYEFREEVYEKNGYPVIFVHYFKEKDKWRTFLARKIKEIEEKRHFEAMKIIDKLTNLTDFEHMASSVRF